LDRLPANDRRLLDIASVMGQIFYPAAVRALSDDKEGVGSGIGALARKQFIRQERSDLSEIEAMAFRHLLIRDAAYDAVPKRTRAELHEGFAEWLNDAGGSLGELDELVGFHLEQAHRYRVALGAAGEHERLADAAGRRLGAAGERAVARGDTSAAINLLTRACALLASDDPLRLDLLTDLGAALNAAGDWDGGRAILDEAINRAAAVGNEQMRTHAVIKRWVTFEEDYDPVVAQGEAERALVVFEATGDERGLARTWQLLSEVCFARGELANAERDLESALVHAGNAGDVGEQTAIYSRLGTLLARGPTPVGAAIRRAEQVLAETAGNRTIAGAMYHPLAHMRARQGDFDEARRLASLCREIHRENGAMWSYWVYCEILWDIEMLAGNPETATEILTEAYEQIERMDETFPLLSAWLAESLYAVGRYEEAEQRAEAAAAAVGDDLGRSAGQGALARVRARQGRVDEAERLAREAIAYFELTDYSTDRTWVLMDLAEVLRLAERPDEAIATIHEAIRLFDEREDVVSAGRARELIEEIGNAASA
jgi:tetratricopeptide (TPR) repeat protein